MDTTIQNLNDQLRQEKIVSRQITILKSIREYLNKKREEENKFLKYEK